MDYFEYVEGKIVSFKVEKFIREHDMNAKTLRNLRFELDSLDGIKAVQYDSVRVKTSNISNPTEDYALLRSRLSEQIKLYELMEQVYQSAMENLPSHEAFTLKTLYLGHTSHPLYTCMDTLHASRAQIYRYRKSAVNHFSAYVIGSFA